MADKSIDANTASFDISGQDAEILYGQIPVCWSWDDTEIAWGDEGCVLYGYAYLKSWYTTSVDVSGSSIEFGRDYALSVDSASFDITGSEVTLSGVTYQIDLATSTVFYIYPNFPSFSTPLLKDWILDADTYSFDISASTVSLEYSSLNIFDVDTTAYSISGSDVSLQVDYIFDVDTEAYEITGPTVSLEGGKTLDAGEASFDLTVSDIDHILLKQIQASTTRIQILGNSLTFSTSEDSTNPVFGSFDPSNYIRPENIRNIVEYDTSSFEVEREDMSVTIEPSMSTYRVA